jgi:DNA-binding Lrp family transcriptional regulator
MNITTIAQLLRISPYVGALAIVAGLIFGYVYESKRANESEKKLIQSENKIKELVAEYEYVYKQQENEYKLKRDLAALEIANTVEHYESLNAKIIAKYQRKLNDQKIIVSARDTDIDQLRSALRQSQIARSENTSNTVTTLEGWRDAHTAVVRQLDTLELACGITTNQFNLCRGYVDEVCTVVDCNDGTK